MSWGKQLTLILFLTFSICSNCFVRGQSKIKSSENYVAEPLIPNNVVREPRGIIVDESGDILVVSRGGSQIHSIYQDGSSVKNTLIVQGADLRLNHGIAYSTGYLYASNSSSVLRWGYSPGQRSRISVEPEVVVSDIPSNGDHTTRTIIIDRYNFLHVTVGSASNVDEDSSRAQIRRFNLAEGLPSGGFTFESGELFVDGVRNVVGLALDGNNDLWGVDCGAADLYREDLGGDIHNTNPADELIRFSRNSSYGYPYCWTAYQLAGHPKGKQFAWPTFLNDGIHSDAWCQNLKNNLPSTLPLPAHNAALGLVVYDGATCTSSSDSFPCSMKGDIFVALHGSSDRQPPAGYKVVRIPVDSKTGLPSGEIEDIAFEADISACKAKPSTCFRPVDLVFDGKGHLIVTSDTSSELIRIRYKQRKDNNNDDDGKEANRVPVTAVVCLVFIALFTGIVLGMILLTYCRKCWSPSEIPYMKEEI